MKTSTLDPTSNGRRPVVYRQSVLPVRISYKPAWRATRRFCPPRGPSPVDEPVVDLSDPACAPEGAAIRGWPE